MEAAEVLGGDGRLLIRDGLRDEHPGVRFASCIAIGRLKDQSALAQVRPLVNDPDQSVRVGAYFALERLGDRSYRRAWAEALTRNPDVSVRRNAALAFGQLGDKGAAPLLQGVVAGDEDDGVRLQALEALALLGDRQAAARFRHDAYGGVGYRQVFALLTLGRIPGEDALPTLRTRLAGAPYLEARLAAARALGMKGHGDGFDLAVAALNWNQPQQGLPDDAPETQVMRVRSMAAMALGEIGDRRALYPLRNRMETPDDPRVQLAAATAMLMVLQEPGVVPAAAN
jgi:HEAT repeat protein